MKFIWAFPTRNLKDLHRNKKLILRCRDIINHRISLRTDIDPSSHNYDLYDPDFDFEGIVPF